MLGGSATSSSSHWTNLTHAPWNSPLNLTLVWMPILIKKSLPPLNILIFRIRVLWNNLVPRNARFRRWLFSRRGQNVCILPNYWFSQLAFYLQTCTLLKQHASTLNWSYCYTSVWSILSFVIQEKNFAHVHTIFLKFSVNVVIFTSFLKVCEYIL